MAVGIQRGCCPTGALGWLWTVPCVLPWPLSSSGALPPALRPHKGRQAAERGRGRRPDLLPVAQAGRPCHALSSPKPACPFSPTLGQSVVDQAVVSALLHTRLSSLHPLLCLLCSGLVAGPEPVGRHPVAGRAVPANSLGLEKEHSQPSISHLSMDMEGACRGLGAARLPVHRAPRWSPCKIQVWRWHPSRVPGSPWRAPQAAGWWATGFPSGRSGLRG